MPFRSSKRPLQFGNSNVAPRIGGVWKRSHQVRPLTARARIFNFTGPLGSSSREQRSLEAEALLIGQQ